MLFLALNFAAHVRRSKRATHERWASAPESQGGPDNSSSSISVSLCRYRKWSLAEDVDLVVRCELDGVMNYKGEDQLLLIKALNEYDSKATGTSLYSWHIRRSFKLKTM